nr:MAG TPA: hypothetical protein [Caudoviricetes sp.]
MQNQIRLDLHKILLFLLCFLHDIFNFCIFQFLNFLDNLYPLLFFRQHNSDNNF